MIQLRIFFLSTPTHYTRYLIYSTVSVFAADSCYCNNNTEATYMYIYVYI